MSFSIVKSSDHWLSRTAKNFIIVIVTRVTLQSTLLICAYIYIAIYEPFNCHCAIKVWTRGMLLLTKAKRPLKFKMLCGFNKHAVK